VSGREPLNGSQYRALVIDDGFWGTEQVGHSLRRALVDCDCVSHMRAESLQSWSQYDLVLLDAYDDIGIRHDDARTRLAALPLLRRAATRGELTRVVVYSTEINSPYIRIPLHETGMVSQFRTAAEVVEKDLLVSLLASGQLGNSVLDVTEADWTATGLPKGARLGEAHEQLRLNRPSVWRLVLDSVPRSLSTDADRKWIKRTVNPLLKVDMRWSQVRQLIRRVARG